MPSPDLDRLRRIKTFPSLVAYLRDDLDWPIESEDFDELTYNYEAEELGIDVKNTYLKKVQAPVGVNASLKAWMELN